MKRLGIIGCGLRSDSYLYYMRENWAGNWALAALADPNPVARRIYRENNPVTEDCRDFESGPAMLEAMQGKLDAVIIASPNMLHTESILPALKQNLITLIEKPAVTSLADAARVWNQAQLYPAAKILIGFVLRYTAFYRQLKTVIDSGRIGKVLSIAAAEYLDPTLTSNYTRNWRRFDRLAGSFILEKCSHDLDILNMLAGDSVKSVSSFAERTLFRPREDAAMRCSDCRFRNECLYSAETLEPYYLNVGSKVYLTPLIPFNNDLCVFNSDKDTPDHQVVNLIYNNNITATFTVAMGQPRTTRTIHICGTDGQLCGDIGDDYLAIRPMKGNWERITVEHDDSPHHGGDSVITNEFIQLLSGAELKVDADLHTGIEAILPAIAAEESRQKNQIIDLNAMRLFMPGF